MLADMESLERRRDPLAKKAKVGDKEAKVQVALIDKALELVRAGKPARLAKLTPEEERPYRAAAAADRQARGLRVQRRRGLRRAATTSRARSRNGAKAEGAGCVVISAKIEAELAAPRTRGARRISWSSSA